VAFPILIANITGELLGGSASPTDAVKPGDPVSLPVASGATGLRVQRPDGSTVDLAPGTAGAGAVTFTQTDLLGVYTATPVFPEGAGPSGAAASVSPTPRPTERPSASPGAGGGPVAGHDPNAPMLFAVDLFDVGESAIAPGKAADLEKLGRQVAAAPSPGASVAPGASPVPAGAKDRPPARDELWLPIVLIVLVGLCVEWTLYHRDVVTRGWRSLTGRLRGAGARQTGRSA
jgi:hypothetical protein